MTDYTKNKRKEGMEMKYKVRLVFDNSIVSEHDTKESLVNWIANNCWRLGNTQQYHLNKNDAVIYVTH